MLRTSRQFQVPLLMLAMHRHHLDYMYQTADLQMIAFQISMPQINLDMSAVDQL